MPNPVTFPENVASTRPALETGFIDGTARDPGPPAPSDPGAGTRYRAQPDEQGRPALDPMPYDNRPRRDPRPTMSEVTTVIQAWMGDEHGEYDPLPSVPDSRTSWPGSAGTRNTFRAQPAPWDSPIYVSPRLDQATDSEVPR